MLLDNGLPLCGAELKDDFILRHNFPDDGIACGSCLRSRRTARRAAAKREAAGGA